MVAAALLLTASIYAAGMGGNFIYDDLPFIAGNEGLRVAHSTFHAWMRAALSFPEAHQGRWLGMLSFALNEYFSGLAVVPFKLTNLAIHLLNGVLLYAMLRRLFALAACKGGVASSASLPWMALAVTTAWMVLPINLTSVLYVTQRFESLCQSFVLLGLAGYFAARLRHLMAGGSAWPMAVWLLGATAAGCAVKESAILLPLYALIADAALTGLVDGTGRRSRALVVLYAATLGVPMVAGMVWLLLWIFGPTTYSMNFGTMQRLYTEARVLVDYLQWTLWPRLDQFALIHDDYALSQGLFKPLSTALSMLMLAGLGAIAWAVRRSVPLATIGISWFFAGHLMTATVIPLDLVFEHRNYFPSIGVLLATASLGATLAKDGRIRALMSVVAILLVVRAAQITARRAYEWGDGWRFALAEAVHRPLSSDAQYAFAVALSQGASGIRVTQEQVETVLAHAARLPGASIAPEATLIIGRAKLKQAIDPDWWRSLVGKLESHPPSTTDINALNGLLQCRLQRLCTDTQPLLDACMAALSRGAPAAPLLSGYADFAMDDLHEPAMAERALRDALAARPDGALYRVKLIRLLRAEHRIPEAQAETAKLRAANRFGELDAMIADLDAQMAR